MTDLLRQPGAARRAQLLGVPQAVDRRRENHRGGHHGPGQTAPPRLVDTDGDGTIDALDPVDEEKGIAVRQDALDPVDVGPLRRVGVDGRHMSQYILFF